MIKEFYEEIKEELIDFVEDYNDLIRKRPVREDVKQKPAVIGGELKLIRPAYLFAERVDNGIKILFGGSLLVSAATATFVGFASLSQLVDVLIKTWYGRLIMVIIGFSYLIVALWKTLHLNRSPK